MSGRTTDQEPGPSAGEMGPASTWQELLEAAKYVAGEPGDHDPCCLASDYEAGAGDAGDDPEVCDCGMSRLRAAIRKAEGRE